MKTIMIGWLVILYSTLFHSMVRVDREGLAEEGRARGQILLMKEAKSHKTLGMEIRGDGIRTLARPINETFTKRLNKELPIQNIMDTSGYFQAYVTNALMLPSPKGKHFQRSKG